MTRRLLAAATCCVVILCSYPTTAKFGDRISPKEKDMMRKSIVFDKKTPDVFYCPMQKPSSMNKLIVQSRPLKNLCQYEGGPLPADHKSDCYRDLDETDYACKEKYRIMKRFGSDESKATSKDNINRLID